MNATFQNLVVVAATLVVSGIGVALARFASLPLPWMLGPLLATAAFGISGITILGQRPHIPKQSRSLFIPVLGVMIASRITPEIVASFWRWWPSLSSVLVYVVLLQLLNYGLFRRLGRFDRATAYFSASPGGLIEATLLGSRHGGSAGRIIMQHSSRVTFAMIVAPFVLHSLGYSFERGSVQMVPEPFDGDALVDLFLLVAAALIGVKLARKLRLPASFMIGPFALASVLYGSGYVQTHIPVPLINLAQLVIGAGLGTRFGPEDRSSQISGLRMSLVALVSSTLFALFTAQILHMIGGVSLPLLFLAFSPGGLSEMSLIAIALHVDPVFVAAHHMVRIIAAVTLSPFVFDRLIAPRNERENDLGR